MRTMVTRKCRNCGCKFDLRLSDVNRGRGLYCGKSCAASGVNNSSYKHGNSTRSAGQTKEYKTWSGVKQRTTNPNEQNSKYYLGRGIKMCDRWLDSFENFLADMGEAPSPKHSIDRIDVNGNYEPGNCRWATRSEQMSNTRLTRWLELDGEKMTQEQWGDVTGIGGTTICKRLKRGWSVEKALTTPKMR